MVTTEKISFKKRKESKCINAKKKHQITKKDSNIGRKEQKNYKTFRK